MTDNLPISEKFRLVGKAWVEANKAANMLEECKSAFLSQLMAKQGDVPVSRAELAVKSSDVWEDYVRKMVAARADADLKKIQLEYIKMQFSEQQSAEATARSERRL